MKELKDIQAILNQKAEEEAAREWADAMEKVSKTLTPFLRDLSNKEINTLIANVQLSFAPSRGLYLGTIRGAGYSNAPMECPKAYIIAKQSKAAEDLLEKIENLSKQLDELTEQVGELNG